MKRYFFFNSTLKVISKSPTMFLIKKTINTLNKMNSLLYSKLSSRKLIQIMVSKMKLHNTYFKSICFAGALAQAESAEYIQLIEKMDHLSELSNWQKLLLCSSIVSSPVYHKEGLKFHIDWPLQNKDILQYVEISLAFENIDFNEEWTAHCVPCKAKNEGDDTTSRETKDLFLVQTFDDKKSIYVFEKEEGLIYLRKYFEHVPIVANAKDPITDDPWF